MNYKLSYFFHLDTARAMALMVVNDAIVWCLMVRSPRIIQCKLIIGE
ncbi:hypothetical protein [Dendronalium sp. ChiSLP03b]|nr:hypothetical protein [Dendronalium sp. ChiSLP03b]MDZ8206622.1 hypothetical protein [Dendronalium sp. ChiSLP03b]